jgi:hypothetical protein
VNPRAQLLPAAAGALLPTCGTCLVGEPGPARVAAPRRLSPDQGVVDVRVLPAPAR